MTTLTITQRLAEGDAVVERSATVETDSLDFDPTTVGDKLVALLHTATWGTPDKPSAPSPKST